MIFVTQKYTKQEMNILPRTSIRSTYALKLHIFLANVLGLFSETTSGQCSYYQKLYTVFVLMIVISTSIWSAVSALIKNLRIYTAAVAIINFICTCNMSFFFIVLLFNSFAKISNWKNLMENLRQFNKHCKRNKTKNDRKVLTISRFVLLRIAVIFYSVVDVIAWEQDIKQDVYLFIPLLTSLFYQINIASMLWELANILKSRYDFLQQYVKRIIKCYSDGVITHETYQNSIDNITCLYKFQYNVVQEINNIFGMTILLLFMMFETSLLVDLCWILDWVPTFRKELYLGSFIWWVILCVSIYLLTH